MASSSIAAWMGTADDPRTGAPDLSVLRREFPFLSFAWGRDRADLSLEDWQDPDLDFWTFDRTFDTRSGTRFRLVLEGERVELERELVRILTRLQRLFGRRNFYSADSRFRELLIRHAAIHDVRRPLVRADYDHALDVWQWVLRLDPDASLALQAAALLHDIERLASEPERRIEHGQDDYLGYKAEHAARGETSAMALVRRCGFAPAVARRVGELVRTHESPSGDSEVQLLNDADSLSFFSLNAPGFAAYFPREHTLRKVEVTLDRMSAGARRRLSTIRMPTFIAAAVARHQARPRS